MNLADFELSSKLDDGKVIDIILKRLNVKTIDEVINFFKDKENKKQIINLKDIKGITINQLSRIIRVDKRIISKSWK